MTCSGRSAARRASSVSSSIYSVMPLTSACSSRLFTGHSRQILFAGFRSALAPEAAGDIQHVFGGRAAIGRLTVQDDILAGLAQLGVDLVIDGQLAGIDDAHIHARLNGVIQEHGMHRLAHRLIAAEAEAEVRHPARDMHMRQALRDPTGRADEIKAVIVVFLDPGRHGEDVGVKDDILGREADAVHQQVIGAGADFHLAVFGIGLPGFVEGHDHDRRAIAAAQRRLMQERLFALFQADRVHHRLALHAFQPGLDHLPFGTVDHHRHAGDIGFGRDQVQIVDHRLFRIDQALIHVDVDDLGAVLDLIAGNIQRGGEIAIGDQLAETGRAGDVGALPHVHEGNFVGLDEGLQPRQAQARLDLGDRTRRDIGHGAGNRRDMLGG